MVTFPFSYVCDLLQQIHDLPLSRRSQKGHVQQLVRSWFDTHRSAVQAMLSGSDAANSGAALLSTLLPSLRTDRVYGVQATALQRAIVRALGLGRSRVLELSRWSEPMAAETGEAMDLADCVEGILKVTPNPASGMPPVSVEEIDALLGRVAARCRFSSPTVRKAHAKGGYQPRSAPLSSEVLKRDQDIGQFYRRLSPRDAKWFTRLILKNYRPVELDDAAVTRAFHPALPSALRVCSDFGLAVGSLLRSSPGTSGGASSTAGLPTAGCVRPRLGVKVGRQSWAKARSIQHCIEMVGRQRVSCESKMDGEYVQVHIDLSRSLDDCLQLFSKSGKDSTKDRSKLHSTIRKSLRIGQPDCSIKTGCILEGEMLAYDEREKKVLDFDAIRKHITRSGSRLYTGPQDDSQGYYEHLMIVYFDVLLVDGEDFLGTRQAERFQRLQSLVTCDPGYAEIVRREVIDFTAGSSAHLAATQLRQAFARCIASRQEGLVLKREDDPYFNFSLPVQLSPSSPPSTSPREVGKPHKASLRSWAIKLKKEYIGAFGDVGDFAVVGARYDAAKAKEYPVDLPGLRWTHFFLGCLDAGRIGTSSRGGQSDNGGLSSAVNKRPCFVIVCVVTLTVSQMRTFLTQCRPLVVLFPKNKTKRRGYTRHSNQDDDDDTEYTAGRMPFDLLPLEPGMDGSGGGPTHLFADPPVVDVRCFSFHRPGYGRMWCPRFPSVTKFHFDRTYRNALTYSELQAMAGEEADRKVEAAEAEAAHDGLAPVRRQQVQQGRSQPGTKPGIADLAPDEETAYWVSQLKRADPGAETSQSSTDAATTVRTTSQATATGSTMSGEFVGATTGMAGGLSDTTTAAGINTNAREGSAGPPSCQSTQDRTSTGSCHDDNSGIQGGSGDGDGNDERELHSSQESTATTKGMRVGALTKGETASFAITVSSSMTPTTTATGRESQTSGPLPPLEEDALFEASWDVPHSLQPDLLQMASFVSSPSLSAPSSPVFHRTSSPGLPPTSPTLPSSSAPALSQITARASKNNRTTPALSQPSSPEMPQRSSHHLASSSLWSVDSERVFYVEDDNSSSSAKKRLFATDVASVHPAVSPPPLKRARTQ